MNTSGTLKPTEYHPAADSAKAYIAGLSPDQLNVWQEAFASTALAGSRLAQVCSETLNRLLTGQPVSDRYLLGVAFIILRGEGE